MKQRPKPSEIILHQQSRTLELPFNTGETFQLEWEYLRVFSPSSEVKGRRGKDRVLVLDKELVAVVNIKPIGNYAIKIYFDDGHNSGLYDWSFLYELGQKKAQYWGEYRQQVARHRTESAKLPPADNPPE